MSDVEVKPNGDDYKATARLQAEPWQGLSGTGYVDLFAKHFARHRQAAVAAERARVIVMLQAAGDEQDRKYNAAVANDDATDTAMANGAEMALRKIRNQLEAEGRE